MQTAGTSAGSATGSAAAWLLSEDSRWTAREVLWILDRRLVAGFTDWDAGATLQSLNLRRDDVEGAIGAHHRELGQAGCRGPGDLAQLRA